MMISKPTRRDKNHSKYEWWRTNSPGLRYAGCCAILTIMGKKFITRGQRHVEKRAELVAVTAKKRAARHLDIWELLPRTNCKQCGEASCLAFAVAVLQNTRLLSECAPLQSDPSFADRKATLDVMM